MRCSGRRAGQAYPQQSGDHIIEVILDKFWQGPQTMTAPSSLCDYPTVKAAVEFLRVSPSSPHDRARVEQHKLHRHAMGGCRLCRRTVLELAPRSAARREQCNA